MRGNNIVRKWKANHGVTSFFNCPQSPDLVVSPIEKSFRAPKQEGFNALTAKTVNDWIDKIPEILQDCYDNGGSITGH
jgi:hypothetical protein